MTGLVVISNWIQIVDFSPLVTLKFDGWHRKNNRAFLLYYVKLCASFQTHQWIQTGVTVRNPLNGVKIEILSHVTLKFDGWPWKTIWHLFFFFYFSQNFEKKKDEWLKRRNTLGCLGQYAVHKIVNMLDPQSHHNPQPKRSSSSGTLNMIPPWNIHTVKQSMPRSCSNGCSLNFFTSSELSNSPNSQTSWSH